MTMSRFSFSRAALLRRCTAWLDPALPWIDSSSDASNGGTIVGAIADAIVKGEPYTMPEDPQLRLFAEHVRAWLDEHRTVGMRSEVPFAWDFRKDRARELPTNGHRDYSACTADEVCGTADLVQMGVDDEGPFAAIDDWKCRFGQERTDARAQLEMLALAACRTFGVDRARCRTLHVDERGVDDESDVFWLDAFDLDGIAASAQFDLASGPKPPTPGEHCAKRYCGAIAACPATQAALAPLVPVEALAKRFAFTPVIQSPDHAAYIVETRARIKKALEQVEKALKLYVAAEPRFTNDGREVKEEFRRMPHTSAKELEELAHRYGAPMEEIAACTRSSLQPNGIRVRKAGGKAA